MDFIVVSKEISIFSTFGWGFIGGMMFAIMVMLTFEWIRTRSHDYRHEHEQKLQTDIKDKIIRRIADNNVVTSIKDPMATRPVPPIAQNQPQPAALN